ncbi:MAG: hypothetical protein D6705_05665 [Deltaproteobacteria bacterium]|nr:MAG: hypothetical protein D6705_05665 [Deltaproteobacteria bacterium]
MSHGLAPVLAVLLVTACGGDDGASSTGGTASGTESSTATATGTASGTSLTGSSSSSSQGSATATGTGTSSTTMGGSDTGTASGGSTTGTGTGTVGSSGGGTATGGGGIIDCNGKVWQCGNGIDDDGDGKVDADDPECTGPCDDDEGSFQTGIPGDNMDCKQDCFFDGNSGSGDDKCEWDLKCDPENPGANIGCPYTPGPQCNNMQADPSPQCKEFCEQYVPNGCDCWGCCRVSTPNGDVDIFLNGDPDCSLDNLDACEPCTYQADLCGNPCQPEQCELCFGQEPEDLPPGCTNPECPNDLTPCLDQADCPENFYCQTGCCYPPPG